MKRLAALAAILCAQLPVAAAGAAARPFYTVSIGYNGVPAGEDGSGAQPLHFADDDAVSVHQLARDLSTHSYLLTILDAETRQRFPQIIKEAQAPSLAELRRVIHDLGDRLRSDRQAGGEPVVLIFYSGHGTRGPSTGEPGLALLDGELTNQILYDELLSAVDARFVHLLVDACHAEAVVRTRDQQAALVEVTEADRAASQARSTLARFPHVGAVLASSASAEAHEWEAFRGGVFTHEVLSALRGAADVNRDGLVEYSELAAFLGAANRDVRDPRARLQTIVRAPTLNPRAPIVDLNGASGRGGHLFGQPSPLGRLGVEDSRGNALVDLTAEPGFEVQLLVPSDESLFVRSARGEAEIRLTAGQWLAFRDLSPRARAGRARGSIETSLHRGLFASGFGLSYYRGFVDGNDGMVAVPAPRAVVEVAPRSASAPSRRPAWLATALTGALFASTAVFAERARQARSDFAATDLQAAAGAARDRYRSNGLTAVFLGLGTLISAGVSVWLWQSPRGDAVRDGPSSPAGDW
jgi:hypothetical protein